MSLSIFAAELFDKIKAWLDPKFDQIKLENSTLAASLQKLDEAQKALEQANDTKLTTMDSRIGSLAENVKEALHDQLHKSMEDVVQALVLGMPKPERGEKGEKGEPGRDGKDALEQIRFVPAIDFEKSYPRDTYGYHKGSLYRSYTQTEGTRGWDMFLAGMGEILIDQIDERRIQISVGNTVKSLTFPVMIYRGVYEQGRAYAVGDVVTLRGSTWHNGVEGNTERPNGPDSGWKMIVRAGRDAER